MRAFNRCNASIEYSNAALRLGLLGIFKGRNFKVVRVFASVANQRQRPVQNSELYFVSALEKLSRRGLAGFACHVATMLRPVTSSQ